MSNSSDYQVTIGRQTAHGTPNLATHEIIRRSGGGHDDKATLEKDGEVSSTGNAVDQVLLDRQCAYMVEGFFSVNTYMTHMENFCGQVAVAKVTVTSVAGDISIENSAGANRIKSTTAGKFSAIAAGQLVELVGFVQFTARKFVLVDSVVSAQELTVDPAFCGTGFTTEAPTLATGKVIRLKQVWNLAAPLMYNTIEERFSVTPGDYQTWLDTVCSKMSYGYSNKQKCSVSFDYTAPGTVDQSGTPATATILTVPPSAAPESRICASQHVNIVQDGNGLVTLRTNSIQLTGTRPMAGLTNHGQLGDDDFVAGDFDFQANFNVYSGGSSTQVTATHAAINRYRNGTPTALWWAMQDPDGKGAWMGIPKGKHSTATRKAGGPSTAVNLDLPINGYAGKHGYSFLYAEFD